RDGVRRAASNSRVFAPAWLWTMAGLLALFAVHAARPFGGADVGTFFGQWVNSAVCLLPGLYIVARALRRQEERAPWLVLGIAATLWGLGNTYFLFAYFTSTAPIPSPADGLWIAFYLTTYAGIVLLMRARIAEFRKSMWLDGLIGGTAVAAVATAIVFDAVLGSVGGSPIAVAT